MAGAHEAGRNRRFRSPAADAVALSLGGTVLLVVAQRRLDGHVSATTALLAVSGLAAWVAALRLAPPSRAAPPVTRAPTAVRRPWLAAAVIAALTCWFLSGGGEYTRWNVAFWVLSFGYWLWAFWPSGARPGGRRLLGAVRRDLWAALAIVAILTAGGFFRFFDLPQVPREPTSDHAEKLLDIADIRSGLNPIFFQRNTGREPLQFYVTTGMVNAGMAPTFETLKVGTAFVGLLGVVGVLLLAWEFAGRAAGLLAAALFSVAQWPVSLSRDGLRHTYAITGSAFALWLLLRYLRTRSRRDLLLTGVALGIGLHGYTAFRIVPLFAALAVAAVSFRLGRRGLAELGILLGTVAVTTLPLLRYAVDHPHRVWFRTLRYVGSSEAPVGGTTHVLHTFFSNLWHAALAFNWRGDSSEVALVRFDPFLDVVAGAAFLAGLLVLGQRVLRRRDARALALAAALPFLSLSSVLNFSFPQENPSASRLGPVAPVVFTVASLSLAWILARCLALPRRLVARGAAAVLVTVALALAASDDYRAFFHDFDRQYRAFVPNTSEAVAAIRATGAARRRVFMLPFAFWIDPRNVGVGLGDIGWAATNVVEPGDPLPRARGGKLVFLLHTADDAGRSRLRRAYPGGSYDRIASRVVGKDFALFSSRP